MHIVDILQQWSENNAFFIWLRESPSVFAYPTVFFIHTLGLIFTAGASVIVDARLLGAARQLPIAPLARYFTAIWIGITLTVLTGVVMLGSDIQTKLHNRLFLPKMLCVVVAIAMTVALRSRIASTRPETFVSPLVRAFAAASLICWLGAIVFGKFGVYF